jgi:biotin transport system substrate-specific component
VHTSLRNQILCAIFTALIAIGAFIRIPVPVVPFTLQFLFTTLAGVLLGARLGALSVIIYIVLGLMGVPVFAEGGGPGLYLQAQLRLPAGLCPGRLHFRLFCGKGRPTLF